MPKIGNDANTDMVNQGGADQAQALTGDAPAAINRAILDTYRELDPAGGDGLARELFALFLEGAPDRMAQARSALAAGDTAALARLAHGFKSSTANVGAEILAGLWRDLESVLRDGRVDEATAAFGLIEHEYARAAAAMRNFR